MIRPRAEVANEVNVADVVDVADVAAWTNDRTLMLEIAAHSDNIDSFIQDLTAFMIVTMTTTDSNSKGLTNFKPNHVVFLFLCLHTTKP